MGDQWKAQKACLNVIDTLMGNFPKTLMKIQLIQKILKNILTTESLSIFMNLKTILFIFLESWWYSSSTLSFGILQLWPLEICTLGNMSGMPFFRLLSEFRLSRPSDFPTRFLLVLYNFLTKIVTFGVNKNRFTGLWTRNHTTFMNNTH